MPPGSTNAGNTNRMGLEDFAELQHLAAIKAAFVDGNRVRVSLFFGATVFTRTH